MLTRRPAYAITNRLRADFQEFCQRVDGGAIQVAFQTNIARSGSLLLQSHFDSHPQIVMYPFLLDFYSSAMPKYPWPGFVRATLRYGNQFATEFNTVVIPEADLEGRQSIEGIVGIMDQIMDHSPTRRTLFLAWHYALCQASGRDFRALRLIYAHEHEGVFLNGMLHSALEDFPLAKVLCTIRDPRGNYASQLHMAKISAVTGVLDFRVNLLTNSGYFFGRCIGNYVSPLRYVNSMSERFQLVRLEDLKKDTAGVLDKARRWLNLDDSPTLRQTTSGGKPWLGDNFTLRTHEHKISQGHQRLDSLWIDWMSAGLEMLLRPEMRILGYLNEPRSFAFYLKALAGALLWPLNELRSFFMVVGFATEASFSRSKLFGIFIRRVVKMVRLGFIYIYLCTRRLENLDQIPSILVR